MKISVIVLSIFGIFISSVNFYLSFLAHLFKKEGERIPSGLPLLGSLLLLIALYLMEWSWFSYLLILFIILDTGGIFWFLIIMIMEIFSSNYKR